MFFGQKLKELRSKHTIMDLKQFKEAMGTSHSIAKLSDIENGQIDRPDCMRYLAQVYRALGLPDDHPDFKELVRLSYEPFVRQEGMFFGKKLKELRLEKNVGLRKMAKKLDILASKYSQIENGYKEPLDALWLHGVIEKLEIGFQSDEAKELTRLWNEPFVMQKMSECKVIIHATKRHGDSEWTTPSTPTECVELTEYLNEYVIAHNEKADEYNDGIQRKNSN